MSSWYRTLAVSEHWFARGCRAVYRGAMGLTVPAPRVLTRPMLAVILLLRGVWYFGWRVFVCEPLFKAYCSSYGRNLRTGVFLHWVQGKGDLIVGDQVTLDGKSNFFFAARYHERPTLSIGSYTGIGHNCAFVVGERITIGRHCRIASSVQMFDVSGHPADPAARLAGEPAPLEDVRPIVIEDNVWIGSSSIIYPGVTIGENSIVAMGSVVMSSVPPNVMVAGNPARQLRSLVSKT